MNKKLFLYLGLTFALSWVYGFGYFALGGSLTAVSFLPVVSIYMFIPAITAVLLQKLVYKAPLTDIGLRWRWNRWLPIAAVIPFLFLLLTIAIGGLLPGVRWATVDEITGVLLTAVPPEQAATLQSLGILLPLILLGGGFLSALIAAFTINGFFALGEELGWRGFVYAELQYLGFWRSSLIIGIVWGLWHLPIIANGYNYPQHPTAGIFMMTLFTIGLTPLHLFVREKAGTVLAPAIMHGSVNALGGLALLYTSGGNDLTVGITGAAGLLALLLLNLTLWFYRQRQPAPQPLPTAATFGEVGSGR